eukprot:403346912
MEKNQSLDFKNKLDKILVKLRQINKFEIADSSLILNPSEDIKKIWILLEKLFEFNNELVSYGCKNEFTFKILSEFYNCTLIKDLAQKNTNISNSILKFDQVLYDLKQNAKQIWRYLLPIGQDVYINEFNNDEDNTNQSMILGKIGRKLSDFNALVICFLDDTGTERNEIIGRWSNRLCLPQIEHELIQQWRQNLQVGHQLLALHEGQKKKTIFSSTILSRKIFWLQIMNINGEIFEDEWVEVSSFKIIPISIFEAHQGSLELVKFLTEDIRTQDFKYIDIHLPLSKEQINHFLGTPLYNACSSGRLEIAQYLMKFYWQINYRTFQDLSPLIIALHKNHLDIAELLIAHGASLNIDQKYVTDEQKIEETKYKLNIANSRNRIIKFLYFQKNCSQNFECPLFLNRNKSVFEKILQEYY